MESGECCGRGEKGERECERNEGKEGEAQQEKSEVRRNRRRVNEWNEGKVTE